MENNLLKSMRYGQTLDVMHVAKDGKITKRRIKVLKLTGDSFQAYCFLRNTKRTFLIDKVLAIIPVERKEGQVI